MHELRLELTQGPQAPQVIVYQIEGIRRLTFGRQGDPDASGFTLTDPQLSREHFEIEVIDGEATLYDLGCKNGTRVDGQAVTTGKVLTPGARIEAGSTAMIFSLLETMADATACASQTAPRITRADLRVSPDVHARNLATVREAWILATGQHCALKEIEIDASPIRQRTLAHFRREARIALRLRHPNIVRVLDAGEDATRIWLLMEWIEGANLEEHVFDVRRRAWSLAETLDLADQLLGALAYTHAKGVVHRDIKPANILVTPAATGFRAILTDFGIASATWEERMTLTNEGKGSYPFMAPEQSQSARHARTPADIYGLAATLYFALSGGRPHLEPPAGKPAGIGAPVPLSSHRPDLPAPLVAVLERCLSPTAAARPQTAHELRDLLARIR